ncbi:hypothetical protein [Leptospira meyeri]|uniref:hypothetical protein n=1 Tax=Leptospira meyeri TaxID=29508 RepID=UPI00223DC999|nr:hypothetical protein [Leptospira meyeri]MCW7490922.1 hypothetical protein [Leptospira meyeri]
MLKIKSKFNFSDFLISLIKGKEPDELTKYLNWIKVCDELMSNIYPPIESSLKITQEEIDRDSKLNFSKLNNWQLICEEILDTEHSHIYYQKCYNELINRGKSKEEIIKMRKFAWLTAGWLNYVKMLWEWVCLDEKDIKLAIELQYSSSIITDQEMNELLDFLELHK